jgi:hypothetical protein
MAAMNTKDTSHDPYEEPEVVRELWRPKCIPIDGGPGKPSINITDALLPFPSTRQPIRLFCHQKEEKEK